MSNLLQQRHYKEIAAIIRLIDHGAVRQAVIEHFTRELHRRNLNFMPAVFMRACQPESQE